MHPLSFIVLALIMMTAHPIQACERNEHGIFEDNNCAFNALNVARKDLKAVYQKLSKQLDPDTREALVASQNAWEHYVSSNARFVTAMEGDGSSGRLVNANEEEHETRVRTEQLRGWSP
jgi:uncharacterized protein YecT (DUF1311 family)